MRQTREQTAAFRSIGIMGPSAVGKEEIAVDYLAPALRMIVVNTGKVARGAALMADRLGQFEEGRGGALRLRDGAESRIRDWALPNGRRGFHFVVSPPDRSAHIFFGDADLTDALHPALRDFDSKKLWSLRQHFWLPTRRSIGDSLISGEEQPLNLEERSW